MLTYKLTKSQLSSVMRKEQYNLNSGVRVLLVTSFKLSLSTFSYAAAAAAKKKKIVCVWGCFC